MWLAVIVM